MLDINFSEANSASPQEVKNPLNLHFTSDRLIDDQELQKFFAKDHIFLSASVSQLGEVPHIQIKTLSREGRDRSLQACVDNIAAKYGAFVEVNPISINTHLFSRLKGEGKSSQGKKITGARNNLIQFCKSQAAVSRIDIQRPNICVGLDLDRIGRLNFESVKSSLRALSINFVSKKASVYFKHSPQKILRAVSEDALVADPKLAQLTELLAEKFAGESVDIAFLDSKMRLQVSRVSSNDLEACSTIYPDLKVVAKPLSRDAVYQVAQSYLGSLERVYVSIDLEQKKVHISDHAPRNNWQDESRISMPQPSGELQVRCREFCSASGFQLLFGEQSAIDSLKPKVSETLQQTQKRKEDFSLSAIDNKVFARVLKELAGNSKVTGVEAINNIIAVDETALVDIATNYIATRGITDKSDALVQAVVKKIELLLLPTVWYDEVNLSSSRFYAEPCRSFEEREITLGQKTYLNGSLMLKPYDRRLASDSKIDCCSDQNCKDHIAVYGSEDLKIFVHRHALTRFKERAPKSSTIPADLKYHNYRDALISLGKMIEIAEEMRRGNQIKMFFKYNAAASYGIVFDSWVLVFEDFGTSKVLKTCYESTPEKIEALYSVALK